jgi:hypothetical protein
MQNPLIQKSIKLGSIIGAIFGGILGLGLGAITLITNGMLIGAGIGIFLGINAGIFVGVLTAKLAGTTGGVSIGAYTGMAAGAFLGTVVGLFIPDSLRMSVNTYNMPILDAIVAGRFEFVVLFSFMLSIVATIIGAWVAGKNFIPRNKVKR